MCPVFPALARAQPIRLNQPRLCAFWVCRAPTAPGWERRSPTASLVELGSWPGLVNPPHGYRDWINPFAPTVDRPGGCYSGAKNGLSGVKSEAPASQYRERNPRLPKEACPGVSAGQNWWVVSSATSSSSSTSLLPPCSLLSPSPLPY